MDKDNNGRLVFICDTLNFKRFTRRATTEAIAKIHPQSIAYCNVNLQNIILGNTDKESDIVKTKYFVRLFPLAFLKFKIITKINLLLNFLFFGARIRADDTLIFLTPFQVFLSDYFKENKTIVILSDPYHLMGYEYEDVKKMLTNADYIFATSKELSTQYLKKYYNGLLKPNVVVEYWPNCVDLEIWNSTKDKKKSVLKKDQITIGFAGNFMKVTDIDLLEGVISCFPNYIFVLAGKIDLEIGSLEHSKLMSIFKFKNVDYKGYIPYESLIEEVANWDIGLMIDKVNELSSYHHHNKLYQYLALGKPVVYQQNHLDYIDIKDVALSARNLSEFCSNIKLLVGEINKGHLFDKRAIEYAKLNSSIVRANAFVATISQYKRF